MKPSNLLPIHDLLIAITLSFFCISLTSAQKSPEPQPGQMAGQAENPQESAEPGLLFYLSGKNEFAADFASGGQRLPNFQKDVRVIEDGPFGPAIETDNTQVLSYWAPGNIYAQQGTISFFWRSRYPVGPTEFPVFRVAYADHSSWDMVWLRIDYNGSGFDAFVTDIGLTRTRVSHFMDDFPGPDEWIHIAMSWDETVGIRLYINGKLVEEQSVTGMIYDTGLDQFGPHSRIISPYAVHSACNFQRGGDLAELRIYDRMLNNENITSLAKGEIPNGIPEFKRDLTERRWRDIWWTRHGWNLPNDPPPVLTSPNTIVRTIEIHDAFDINRWYWKANDGIRETTWPGVYNKSRLPGRYDYFVIPDWDCYSISGQTIRFDVPESQNWNHVEIWGKAWGQLTHESGNASEHTFAVRKKHQVKSFHRLNEAKSGGKIRFDNALIEEPIGSFMLYNVKEGKAPSDKQTESFRLLPAPSSLDNNALDNLRGFIIGRYPIDERATMIGTTNEKDFTGQPQQLPDNIHPLIHILLPYYQANAGLDGVEITIPAFNVAPTHGTLFPMNIRIKDPVWPMRDLADYSFSIEPGKEYKLWIDTRDRILPDDKALYLTLAGAGADLKPELLTEVRIKLVYKPKEEALAEHIPDRFTQLKDIYAHNVEERPRSPRFNNYNRFYADAMDLLKHDPEHWLGNAYWYAVSGENRPEYDIPPCPEGVPEWAHLQIEYLRHLERIADFYIDERQILNGEFGGGLNDDGKFTFFFAPLVYSGVQPEKISASLALHMKAYFKDERDAYHTPLKVRSLPYITNGISTLQGDELHNYEDGIQVMGQMMLLEYGNPIHFNRGLQASRTLAEKITQISPDGYRRFRSRYYSGTCIAKEDPWQWSVPNSSIIMHPAFMVARYNGNPIVQNMIIELADGFLATAKDEGIYTEVHFQTGEVRNKPVLGSGWMIFQAAYDYTGEEKYLEPVKGRIETRRPFDPDQLAKGYEERVIALGVNEFINTEGSVWIDRVSSVRSTGWMQEHRLGGIAVENAQNSYPRHRISWKFHKPSSYEDLAVFVRKGDRRHIEIIVYNLSEQKVQADLTTWEIDPGKWKIRQGTDKNEDQKIDNTSLEQLLDLERGNQISFSFKPRCYTILEMEIVEDAKTGYWKRPDLAIGPEDVSIQGNEIHVRIHNLGAVRSPECNLEIRDAEGNAVITAKLPPIEAPSDLIPRWTDIKMSIPENTRVDHGSVIIDPEKKTTQITRRNTVVSW